MMDKPALEIPSLQRLQEIVSRAAEHVIQAESAALNAANTAALSASLTTESGFVEMAIRSVRAVAIGAESAAEFV